MIESIEFKNFKCLRNATLPLSPCTILVGPNGSGKSTVLQALEAVNNSERATFQRVVTADARDDQRVADVEVFVTWGGLDREVITVQQWGRDGPPRAGNKKGSSGFNLVTDSIRRIRVYSLDAAAIAAPVTLLPTMELARNGAALAGVLQRLRDCNEPRFEALNAEFTQWLPEFDRISFDMHGDRRALFLQTRDGHHKIPAADASQGTLVALTILTLAHLPEPPSIVGLEEPDRGLHPYLLRHLQDAIYRLTYPESCGEDREPVQVIATTHNPYFLNLFKDSPEEIVVANKTGADVQFQRFSDHPHFQDVLGDAPLGEAWFTGFFGGVPSPS